jgi:hypothetical protein
MNDYDKGYQDAVNRILELLSYQAHSHAELHSQRLDKRNNTFHYRALALIDFKLYIEQLFKTHVMLSENKT